MTKYSAIEMTEKGDSSSSSSSGSNTSSSEQQQHQKKPLGISSLFSSGPMTRVTLVMFVNWVVVTIGYYGISLVCNSFPQIKKYYISKTLFY